MLVIMWGWGSSGLIAFSWLIKASVRPKHLIYHVLSFLETSSLPVVFASSCSSIFLLTDWLFQAVMLTNWQCGHESLVFIFLSVFNVCMFCFEILTLQWADPGLVSFHTFPSLLPSGDLLQFSDLIFTSLMWLVLPIVDLGENYMK